MGHAAATTKTWRKNAIYMSQQHAECSQQHADCSSMLCRENQNFKKMTIINFIFPSETASISLATMPSISLVLVDWTLLRSTSKMT